MKATLSALILSTLLGCSHFTLEEARQISTQATNIQEVYDLIGQPEEVTWGIGTEEARWVDRGWHTKPMAFIPLLNIALLPIWATDYFAFNHDRGLIVTFNQKTGSIISVSPMNSIIGGNRHVASR